MTNNKREPETNLIQLALSDSSFLEKNESQTKVAHNGLKDQLQINLERIDRNSNFVRKVREQKIRSFTKLQLMSRGR